jgi:hypothetical protein
MKKMRWRMKNLKKTISRIYKGYTDLVAILAMFIGAVLFSYGVILTFCAEPASVAVLFIGGFFIFAADELFRYGRT